MAPGPTAATMRRGNEYPIPKTMQAWVLGGPEELALVEKPVPEPGPAEVLVRIDAIAVCATDIEIIRHGVPAMIDGELPFNKGFTPGHEYMGTVVKLGPTVDEFEIGDRVTVEVHAGCGRCQRCREGMYTSCLNYGYRKKGHRAKARNDNSYDRGEGNEARAFAHGSPREGPKASAPVERQRLAPAVAECHPARLRAALKFRADRVLAIG